jgi:hypothetical protein
MKNTIEAELKKLTTIKNKLEFEIEDIKRQRTMMGEELTLRHNQISKLNNEISSLKSKSVGIIVSEHAILRYIERVIGIDLETIKAKIASDSVKKMAETMGNGTYTNDGFKIKVVDNVIVTVLTQDDKKAA